MQTCAQSICFEKLQATAILNGSAEYFEQEQEPPRLGSLTALGPHLQPLICLLHRHELISALGVLVGVILPCQLPALHQICKFTVLATLNVFDAIKDVISNVLKRMLR